MTLICILAVAVGAGFDAAMQSQAPTVLPQASSVQAAADCIPSPDNPGNFFKPRRIRDGKWQQTVILGRCVSDAEALAILRAIRDGGLVNQQRVLTEDDSRAGKAGQQANMPPLHVSQVSSIQRTYPELLEAYRAPAHQFMVTTVDTRSSSEGLTLYINLRDGQAELVGYGFWMS